MIDEVKQWWSRNYNLILCVGLAFVVPFAVYDLTRGSAHSGPVAPCWHISETHGYDAFGDRTTDYYSHKAPDIEGSFANFTNFFGQQYALAGNLTITKETCPAEASRPEKEAK